MQILPLSLLWINPVQSWSSVVLCGVDIIIEIKLTNHNLQQWNTKQAATQDSTALYNRTQSCGTQAFNFNQTEHKFSMER